MPKPIGFSEHTADKQEALDTYCDVLFGIIRGILGRYASAHQEMVLTDLNAGSGMIRSQPGSSLIMVRRAFMRQVPFHLWACEIYEQRADDLRGNLLELIRTLWTLHRHGPREHAGGICPKGRCPACDPLAAAAWVDHHVTIVVGDHNHTVGRVIADIKQRTRQGRSVYGLAYGDGNGQVDHPIGPLIQIASEARLHCVDLLVHVNAAVIKRTRTYARTEQGAATRMGQYAETFLMEGGIAAIKKAYRLVRRPRGQQQWTFFSMSNWDAFPKFRRLGFVDAESDEGRRIIAELNLTPEERPSGQIPFDPDLFTVPTPSISVIHDSEPSERMLWPDVAAGASDATPLEQRRSIT